MTQNQVFDQVLQKMATQGAGGLKIPPPIFLEMGAEIIAVDLDEGRMQARFPLEERFTNPLGYVQGGIIGAALDNTIGPLSFLVAPPSVTITFNMTFLKPIKAPITHYLVTATFDGREDRKLHFSAYAHDADESIIYARGVAEHLIVMKG